MRIASLPLLALSLPPLLAAATPSVEAPLFGDLRSSPATPPGVALASGPCPPASATPRNAGTNPDAYTVSTPTLGGTLTATVSLAMTNHASSVLFAFDSPADLALGGGQRLLCLDTGGNGELLTGQGVPGTNQHGIDVYALPIPSSPDLCGLELHSQALLYGNTFPYALTNAQDLVIGS